MAFKAHAAQYPRPDDPASSPVTAGVRLDCAVVIPCHNYGRYLAEALDSVLAQTRPAAEILVVDDASDDETAAVAARYAARGVRYLRVANRSVYRNRLLGLAETTAAALVRRAALQSVDWPAHVAPGFCHEDWFMWRQLVRLGWRVTKSPVPLRYRRHGTSMMATGGNRYEYFQFANLALETVQIVLPLAGRAEWLPRLQCWVERQTWPRISVLVLDTSPDPALRRDIRQWLATLHCETQYLPLPPTGAVANLERRGQPQTCHTVQQLMPRIYLPAVQRLTREYVMWVEDDVLPPLDAIERLMHRMSESTACVSGVVVSRFNGHLIGWDPNLQVRTQRGRGVERLHGTGFGCLLVRHWRCRPIPSTPAAARTTTTRSSPSTWHRPACNG